MQRDEAMLARMQAAMTAKRESFAFYQNQIEEAQRRGVEAFDAERFMRARRK